MSDDLHSRAGEVFLKARALAGAAREAFLTDRCMNDPSLRAEVESLLAHDHGAAPFDTPLPAARIAQALAPLGAREQSSSLPARIGQYRILSVLGEGGMGVVYRAEQETPRRLVALKIIRGGSRRPELLRRFEREAEALARLQHPGIAQVFEVGQAPTDSGPCPYLAMELVEGTSLIDFVRDEGLSPGSRLALLAQIADAVHHAHSKGVIHRDLKPGNILVVKSSSGTASTATDPAIPRPPDPFLPKVLDFGVARLLDDAEATSVTDPGQLVGTIRYMSPEQLGPGAHTADVRSDVYALGLIGYELLTGQTPYVTMGLPLAEVVRTIRETEPDRLSRHDKSLAGDPDIIIAKALEKDPARRYASAAELADDLRRCLADQPIMARPATAAYQLAKFARRNRALVAAAGFGLVALLAVAVVSTAAYFVTSRERDAARQAEIAAQREADKALRALEFLRTMLTSADPNRAESDVRVAAILDRAADDAGKTFANQPESEAMIRYTLGTAYHALGIDDNAIRELQTTTRLRTDSLGPAHPDTLAAQTALADVLVRARRPDEALAILDQLLVLRPVASRDPIVPSVLNLRAEALMLKSRFDEAEAAIREALRLADQIGATPGSRASYEVNFAMVLERQGRLDDAERAMRSAIDALESAWGLAHGLTLTARTQHASVLNKLGRTDESIAALEKITAVRREAFGATHPSTLTAISNLGSAYMAAKRQALAAPLFQEALSGLRSIAGPDDERVITAENNLGSAYLLLGRYAEAEPILRESREAHRRTLGPNHQKTLTASSNLGKVLHKQHKLDEASAVYSELLPLAEQVYPKNHWALAALRLSAAQVLTDMKQYDEAERLLLAAIPVLEATLDKPGKRHDYTVLARKTAAEMYEAWGKPERADAYRDVPVAPASLPH